MSPAAHIEALQFALRQIAAGESLTRDEAAAAMDAIMSGNATGAQFGALTFGLHLKGETVEEIAGFAATMRRHAIPVRSEVAVVDTCGTGGDGSDSFNVSTVAAFVAAGAGAVVAKHGNRAMSSICGSADVLEALGARIDLEPEHVERMLREVGIAFMFAPMFHPAMKHAVPHRREMKVRTVFNILGPLTNPASARHQVIGVGDHTIAEKMALVLHELGSEHALVVSGTDGLDEFSIAAPTVVYELFNGSIEKYEVSPQDVGLTAASLDTLRGGAPATNAAIARSILEGEPGPRRDVVTLNAGAAIYAADLAETLAAGVRMAETAIDDGAALSTLESFIKQSRLEQV